MHGTETQPRLVGAGVGVGVFEINIRVLGWSIVNSEQRTVTAATATDQAPFDQVHSKTDPAFRQQLHV